MGYRAWTWWFQVFKELLAGLTDAWKHMLMVWWQFVSNSLTMDKSYYDHVTNFFEHGVNPANLFGGDFQKFRMGVMFWRFILAAVFTVIRTTALINLPANAIRPNE